MSAYMEACSCIEGLVRFTKKHSHAQTRKALGLLGDPDRAFKIIHVAGTNGKGSVCSFLDSILREAGYRTGLFTSPHLVEMRERFRIDGEIVSEESFLTAFYEVRERLAGLEEHPSYFEFLYLMGTWLFRKAGVKIAVVETGLGGRLDATNTVEEPLMEVITSISFDHMQYLGNTLGLIAEEKAGIIKEGAPLVFLAARREAAAAVIERALKLRARAQALVPPSADPEIPSMLTADGIPFSNYKILKNFDGRIDFLMSSSYDGTGSELFRIRHTAPYQAENAALACLAAKTLEKEGLAIPENAILKGLYEARWEGRMEEVLPGVFMDGAHNADGIARFLEAAETLLKGRGAMLVFAAAADKDYGEMIREICERLPLTGVVTTEIPGSRSESAFHFAKLFRDFGLRNVVSIADAEKAFQYALREKGNETLLICGSLYLIGFYKGLLNEKPLFGTEQKGKE
ncbi:MAG: bifunctional folylpolyglutamate synthase/dihydrofolate synthase [Lachnospiraceae bacterium]|nr:bifunctional folylpolyglutamate synthase/dihydrofolate synthase [Lachnospiraceae bacterium]